MSTVTTPRLSLLHVDFDALYQRHLGRHSQLGINIAHLVALYGMWFGVYAAVAQGAYASGLPAWPILAAMATAYLAVVAINAPFKVLFTTLVFVALFVLSVLAIPALPAWTIPLFLLLTPIFYKIQALSHKVWNRAADMTEFNRRFPPGKALNLILTNYEVPTCLYYLVFRRRDWVR